jgi:transmembrane sensor
MKSRQPNLDEIDSQAAAWVARRDAGLNEQDQRAFADWCAENPLHAEALRRFETTWLKLGRPRRTGVATTLRSELESRLRQRRRRRIMAGVALALLATGGWWGLRPPPSIQSPSTAALVHSAILSPVQRTLADGSRLELADGAAVQVNFTPEYRRVTLVQGEVHFSVAKDATRPFIVTAGGIEFRAIGTAFSVTLDATRVDLLVTEGRVTVEKPVPVQTAPPLSIGNLAAGEQLSVQVDHTAATPAPVVNVVAPAEIARLQAWRRPRVEFSGAPLSEVVAVLNRQQPRRIELGEPALAQVTLSGRFLAEDIEVFTALLESGFGIKADEQNGVLVLRRIR